MKSFTLPITLIPDTNFQKLQRSLPPDYFAKRIVGDAEHPQKFVVKVVHNSEEREVATVFVENGDFVFEVADDAFSSNYFNGWMTTSYPETDPDRMQWIVVYIRDQRGYSYFGKPQKTSGLALKKTLVPSAFDKPGAYLVAFKASQLTEASLIVEQSYLIAGRGVSDFSLGEDEGRKTFLFASEG